ncbi:carboxylesterase/lipase family protein [Burkholderia sp. MR1-5-21]
MVRKLVFDFRVESSVVLAILMSATIAGCGGSGPTSDPTIVGTQLGFVKGAANADTVTFMGIPYAQPPVGDLRFKAPVPAEKWQGIYDATHAKSKCIQGSATAVVGSEDCLYLNLYKPSNASADAKLPVLVWFYGGGFNNGSGSGYDGSALAAQQNVIVVTLNYRLRAFGFLAHPALSAEANGHSGNYGILDQQQALQWVRSNISAFGGDKANVTIFGQSAGGTSVMTQLASPLASSLFDKAAAFSADYVRLDPTLQTAEANGVATSASLGCSGTGSDAAKCLRSLPVSTLIKATPGTVSSGGGAWNPVIDNYVLNESTTTAFSGGRFNKVPFMDGSVHDEGTIAVASGFDKLHNPITMADYGSTIESILLAPSAQVLSLYPAANYFSPGRAFAAAYTDSRFICATMQDAGYIANSGSKVFVYEFDEDSPSNFVPDSTGYPPAIYPTMGPWGDYHSSDLASWWGIIPASDLTVSRANISKNMMTYLGNFAKNGDPNGAGLPTWSSFSSTSRNVMSFADPINPNYDAVTAHHCDYWYTVPPSPRLAIY